MIYEESGLICLLRLSSKVEAVLSEARIVEEILIDPEEPLSSPDRAAVEDIAKALELARREIELTISRYPEEKILELKERISLENN